MKMLMITNGVTIIYFIFYFFTYRSNLFISEIESTDLKYETPMFQEFRTQNRTHAYTITVLFPIWVYVYSLYFTL